MKHDMYQLEMASLLVDEHPEPAMNAALALVDAIEILTDLLLPVPVPR
jgi:hypothetical protein